MPTKPRKPVLRHLRHFVLAAIPATLAIAFLAFAWIDRREVFQRLSYSVFDGDNWLPYVWSLLALVLLVIQVRRAGQWRSLKAMRLVLAFLTALVIVVMVAGKSGWARYQCYRWECFHRHLGITSRGHDETESQLVELLTNEAIGSQLSRDREMLNFLAFQRPSLFARRPYEANLALRSLLQLGTDFGDFQSSEPGREFLLYAVAGDVFREDRFAWSKQANSTQPIESKSTAEQNVVQNLFRSQIDSLESLSDPELEALVFCVGQFPDLVSEQQRQQVLAEWLEWTPELTALLGEEYDFAATLREVFGQDDISQVRFSLHQGYTLPVEAERRQVLVAIPRALQTLVQLTSGLPAQFAQVDEEDSSIDFKISVDGDELQEYQEQVYQWSETYEPGYRFGRGYQYGRWKSERVATGETRTVSVYGATVKLETPSVSKSVEPTATLVYWADYLRADTDDPKLDSVRYEHLSGRMWPIGIHESYFRGGDAF